MGQQLKKVRGRTLSEAYEAVRRKYGDDAVVLGTHSITEGGVLGFLGRKKVELTVSVAESAGTAPQRRPSPVEKKYAANSRPGQAPEMTDTVQYFEKLVREAQERMRGQGAPSGKARPQPRSAPPEFAGALDGTDGSPLIPFPRRKTPETAAPHDLRRELNEIREMVQVIYAESPGAGLPAEFAPHYRTLVSRGVSRKVAAALIGAVLRDSDLSVLRDPRIFSERLHVEIRRLLQTTGGLQLQPGRCHVAALCGPTGVGKTTNLAKLAAHFSVSGLATVGLVTADTYRVGAAEQLRVYANIIGLPLRVVHNPKEVRAALAEFREYDLVLMDTAGSSQFNLEQINELKGILHAAHPNDVLLVMSASTQLDDLRNVAANYKCLNPTSILFGKLDETRQYGALFSVLMEAKLPLSYVSVGQNVPDDLRVAAPGMVANLILGGSEHRG